MAQRVTRVQIDIYMRFKSRNVMIMLLGLVIEQLRRTNQHNDTNNNNNISQNSNLASLAGRHTQCSYYIALREVQ